MDCTQIVVLSCVALPPRAANKSGVCWLQPRPNLIPYSIVFCCLGSPPVHGEENEDVDADDVSDYNYQASGNQDQKQKIAERMLTWRTNSRGSDIGLAKYDSGEIGHGKYDSGEIPRGYIPSLTHSQVGVETLDFYLR